MLRDVYVQVGLGWTILIGGLIMLTAISWFVAMAGAVVRPMSRVRRFLLLGLLTLLPPSAVIVLLRFIATTRAEYRVRSRPPSDDSPRPVARVAVQRAPMRAVA